MSMTKKQRFMAALRRETPDVVPVAPLIHSRFAHALLGRSDWRAVFEVHQSLGSTYYRGPIAYRPTAKLPDGWGMDEVEPCPQPDGSVIRDIVLRTPQRTMLWRRQSGITPGDPLLDWTIQYPVRSAGDWRSWIDLQEQVLAHLKEPDLTQIREAVALMGEEGVPSVGAAAGFTWAGAYRGMEGLLTDLYDCPDLVTQAFVVGRRIMEKQVEAFLSLPAEVCFLDICWATGANMGPKAFARLGLPDVVRAVEMVKKVPGKYLGLYTLGRIRDLLPMLVETGVDFIGSFEQNQGDIPLVEAKASYGDRICVLGNFDPMILAFGTLDEARQEALRCLREGMEGGGYIMTSGDEVPADAKLDNLRVMVEVAQEFGRYS
jgi:uroporphyrinogen-III decarboxylase